jgi:Acetyltransferases, including N-acetylases of ribosomal proteins
MPDPRMRPPESFTTERLLLRKPRAEDAALIFAGYAQDPEVTRYLTFTPHRNLKDTHEAVDRFLDSWRSGKSYCWLIFRRDDGARSGPSPREKIRELILVTSSPVLTGATVS